MSCTEPIIAILVIAIAAAMAWQKWFAPLGSGISREFEGALRRLGRRSPLLEVSFRTFLYVLGLLKKGAVPVIFTLGGTAMAVVGKQCGGLDIPASLDAAGRFLDAIGRLMRDLGYLVHRGAHLAGVPTSCSDLA